MEKWILAAVLLFIFLFGGVILMRLLDSAVLCADKTMKTVPMIMLKTLELALVVFKAIIRVSARIWRNSKPGTLSREPRQEVGPNGVHVRVNIPKTKTFGHEHAYLIIGRQPIREPITINHQ